MKVSVRTYTNPKRDIKDVLKAYKYNYFIKVGFPEGKADVTYPYNPRRERNLKTLGLPPTPTPYPTVKEVAAKNEFGVSEEHIPARPFMKKSSPKVVRLMRKYWKQQYELFNKGSKAVDVDKAVNEIAPLITDVYKKMITDLHEPPNAQLTIFLKESDNPLVDTGLMRATVTNDIKKERAK